MPKTIFVRSATKDRKVALSEGHEDHPNGEAWVVGYPDIDGKDDPANIVEVGATQLVRTKIAAGDLLEVEKPMARQQAARATPTNDDPIALALGQEVADRLAAAGYDSQDSLQSASDEELLGIDGIGQATLRRIRAEYPDHS